MGLSGLDLCPSLQGIHTSSTHSSPGASPRNSITDETYLQPQHQHITSSIPHQRSRSASPHGKRSYGQADSCQGGTPVKQRSRSPSPIPSPHEQQGSYYLHQNQVHTEFQPQAQTSTPGVEEILSSLSSSLPRVMPSAVARDAHGQVQRQDCVYGEGYDWAIKQDRMGRAGPEVKSETIYVLPAVWPSPHPVHHGAFGCVVCPFFSYYSQRIWLFSILKCEHKLPVSTPLFANIFLFWVFFSVFSPVVFQLHFHLWSGRCPVSPVSTSFKSSSSPNLTTELTMRPRAAEEL